MVFVFAFLVFGLFFFLLFFGLFVFLLAFYYTLK